MGHAGGVYQLQGVVRGLPLLSNLQDVIKVTHIENSTVDPVAFQVESPLLFENSEGDDDDDDAQAKTKAAMAHQNGRGRVAAAVLVGICIGRMSVSLPLESRLAASDANSDLTAAWVASLASPPLFLLEIAVSALR